MLLSVAGHRNYNVKFGGDETELVGNFEGSYEIRYLLAGTLTPKIYCVFRFNNLFYSFRFIDRFTDPQAGNFSSTKVR